MLRKILIAMGLMIIALVALLWWSYSGAIVRFPVDEKFVVLTYDDGPNPGMLVHGFINLFNPRF